MRKAPREPESAFGSAPGRAHRPVGAATIVFLLLAFGAGAPARAQQEEGSPLTKSDVVRLLASSTYTQPEIASIIGRVCLTFRPSLKDMADFRHLGASDGVISAVLQCRGASASRATASSSRRQPGSPQLRSEVSPATAAVTVGSDVVVTVTLRRGTRPAAGMLVALTGDLPPGIDTLSATTDAAGRATFQIPAGLVPGQRVLDLATPAGSLTGSREIRILAMPGAAARADVAPDRIVLLGPGDAHREIRLVVRDSLDNPVPDQTVSLRTDSGQGSELGKEKTDQDGTARFEVTADALGDATRLQVLAEGRPIARLPVLRPDSSDVHIALRPVSSGTGSRPDSVVVRLTGPGDAPLPGVPVHFDAEPGNAHPSAAVTDPDGRAAVALRGTEVSETVVTARAGPARGTLRLGSRTAVTTRGTAAGDDAWLTWLALGRAYSEAGQPGRARRAFDRALSAAPLREEAQWRIDQAGGMPPVVRVGVGGEARYAGTSGAHLAGLQVEAWPVAGVRVWGRYDRSLDPGLPILVRGAEPMKAFLAGAAVSYGPLGRLRTSLELGRRQERLGWDENYARLQQSVGFSVAGHPADLQVGGLLGRWYDRDDWAAYATLELPLGTHVALRPAGYVGRLGGTEFARDGHRAARDRRAYLGLVITPEPRWRIEAALGTGSVESDVASLSGHIFDSYVRMGIPLARGLRLRVLGRHQSPPGADAFTVLDAELVVGIR